MKKITLLFFSLVVIICIQIKAQNTSLSEKDLALDSTQILKLASIDDATLFFDTTSNRLVLSESLRASNILYAIQADNLPNVVIVEGNANDNNLTVDTSVILKGIDVIYKGGAQNSLTGDVLTINGSGIFDTIEHQFINENDGSVIFNNQTTISYVGLEPVNDNASAVNRIFSFTGGAETITLSDDSVPNDDFSMIDSTLGESVTFLHPTASLIINTEVSGGSGADNVEVEGLDTLFDADLSVLTGTDDVVLFQANITDVGTGNISVSAMTISCTVNVQTTATGFINFDADANIAVSGGAVVSTVDGGITFNANTFGSSFGTNILAIQLNSGHVLTTGSGVIAMTGRGSSDGTTGSRYGIRAFNSSSIDVQGSGSISLNGFGGDGLELNQGIRVNGAGTVIRSNGGGIDLIGIGGIGSGSSNIGVSVVNGALIEDVSTGAINISGTGGSGSSTTYGVQLLSTTTLIRTNGGDMSITGQGGSSSTNSSSGVFLQSGASITDLVGGNITINGTGGSGTSNNEGITLTGGASVSTTNGNLTLNGISTETTGANENGIRLVDSTFMSVDGDINIEGTAGNSTSAGFIISTHLSQVNTSGNISINTSTGPFATATATPATTLLTGATITIDGETNPGFNNQGVLTTSGTTSFPSGAILTINFVGVAAPNPGINYDQLDINGVVDITDATLNLVDGVAGMISEGATYTIVNNDDIDAVVGTFNGLPNGSVIPFNGQNFLLFYDGGDGNDVVLILDSLPVAMCQNITVQLDGTGTVTILPEDIDDGSSDADGPVTLSLDITSFTCADVGANTVTLTVTDSSGNTTSCMATVTVEDDENPMAICQDITVQLDATGNATIVPADIDNGSTDNCGIVTSSIDIDTFDCSDVGTPVVVTLTLADAVGNTSSCTAVVTVEDTVAPDAICQDITIILDSNGMATIVPADIDGGSTDACGINSLSVSMNTFNCSNVGPNNVTLTVADVNGNVSSCVAVVTVEEENAVPMAFCQNLTVPLQQDGTATITPESVSAGSTGAGCIDGLTLDIDTFDCSDIGTPVTVTLTVMNGNGDTDSCTALITVVDSLEPIVTCPEDQLIEVIDQYILPDYFATGEATADDNCTDPVTIFTQDPAPGTPLGFGVYTIELTATDDFGHTGACTFELTIGDILGVDDSNLLSTVVLFPNPTKGAITINNPQVADLKQLNVYDTSGRMVQEEDLNGIGSTKNIDISALQASTYLFVLQTENGQLVKYIVKE